GLWGIPRLGLKAFARLLGRVAARAARREQQRSERGQVSSDRDHAFPRSLVLAARGVLSRRFRRYTMPARFAWADPAGRIRKRIGILIHESSERGSRTRANQAKARAED